MLETSTSPLASRNNPQLKTIMTETKDPIVEFLKLAEQVRELCPKDQEHPNHGKYVNLTVSGYPEMGCAAHVYFGDDCRFDVSSMAELAERLAEYDPETSRKQKIERTKRELAELQVQLAKLETEAA